MSIRSNREGPKVFQNADSAVIDEILTAVPNFNDSRYNFIVSNVLELLRYAQQKKYFHKFNATVLNIDEKCLLLLYFSSVDITYLNIKSKLNFNGGQNIFSKLIRDALTKIWRDKNTELKDFSDEQIITQILGERGNPLKYSKPLES